MGSSSNKQTQQSSTGPWAPTQDALKELIGQIDGTSLGPNQYGHQIEGLASNLLSGGPDRTGLLTDALSDFRLDIQPHTSAQSMDILSNPIFQQYLQGATNDAVNSVKSQFASAGQDVTSGQGLKAIGEGIGRGTAPAFVGAYDSAANRNLSAINAALNGTTSTAGLLGNLDNMALSRGVQGVDVAGAARALPFQDAQIKSSMLLPIAGLGSEGFSTTTQKQSANPVQVATGGLLGGLGLMSGYGGYNPWNTFANGVYGNSLGGSLPSGWRR